MLSLIWPGILGRCCICLRNIIKFDLTIWFGLSALRHINTFDLNDSLKINCFFLSMKEMVVKRMEGEVHKHYYQQKKKKNDRSDRLKEIDLLTFIYNNHSNPVQNNTKRYQKYTNPLISGTFYVCLYIRILNFW